MPGFALQLDVKGTRAAIICGEDSPLPAWPLRSAL